MNIQLSEVSVNINTNLYEQDYLLWLQQTAKILRNGRLSELDTENLAEEIEDMGKSEKRAIESNLEVLLMHLLKYKYQSAQLSNSWKYTIREHRNRIKKSFRDSPSLKLYFQEVFAECYQKARELAADETGLPIDIFPHESPFTSEETLNTDYLPPE